MRAGSKTTSGQTRTGGTSQKRPRRLQVALGWQPRALVRRPAPEKLWDKRKAELILGINNIRERRRPLLFTAAADSWLASKPSLTKLGKAYYKQYVGKLKREFGTTLITDIGGEEVADLQKRRLAEGLSNRQVNGEVATLRSILKRHKLWAAIADDIRMLKDDPKPGRAFTPDEEEERLLEAAAQSPSPSLYPFLSLRSTQGLRRWRRDD